MVASKGMNRRQRLLQILSDGLFHSGEELAKRLEVSRAAVWKMVRGLQADGLALHALRGQGYRLAEPLEFLAGDRIVAAMEDAAKAWLSGVEIHQRLDSTNSYLINRASGGLASGHACLAESQTAGRGRLGRSWVSPYATNLYLSLLWRFQMGPALLIGLSLAAGVAVARALRRLGITEIGLKWPNDVLWHGLKLGGILLEFGGESAGPCHVVAGVGLNVAMPEGAGNAIDQPWVDLRTIVGPGRISRNALAAIVLSELVQGFVLFEKEGFEGFREDWERLDLVHGKSIILQLPAGPVSGIAQGVDEYGALCLETPSGVKRYLVGEVSLRLAD